MQSKLSFASVLYGSLAQVCKLLGRNFHFIIVIISSAITTTAILLLVFYSLNFNYVSSLYGESIHSRKIDESSTTLNFTANLNFLNRGYDENSANEMMLRISHDMPIIKNEEVIMIVSSTFVENGKYMRDRIIPSSRTWMKLLKNVYVIVEGNLLLEYIADDSFTKLYI
jgi:hypothetical protein